SSGNLSGACAVDAAGRIIDERMLGSDDDIIDWIKSHLAARTVVAIDAPLQVPNETGRRPCETELSRDYGSRKAGPHSSNRSLLMGIHRLIRGEEIAARLAYLGFGDPWAGSIRTVLEAYPHPAIIEAFGLPERLIYKAKKGVSVADRRRGLRTLSCLIATLADATPPLHGPSVSIDDSVRGAALKAVEDRLDARICAWVAAIWGQKPSQIRLYGDGETGHIAVPVGRFSKDG
ncbi:MAG: DUF429 domain-containing protein, partial [Acidimicrobiia bacterium]|nr:DUF429 domain-containing protein [Acidimicrobiia bacterium]